MDPTASMVQTFERLCTIVNEPDESSSEAMNTQVKKAQTQIMGIVKNDAFWNQVPIILQKTTNNYAITIAANAYRDFMTQKWNHYGNENRIKVRIFAFRVMRDKIDILEPFARMALINLITRITKLGWFDDPRYKSLVEDAKKLLIPDRPKAYCLGIDLLAQLVAEMNKPLRNETVTDHRKVAVSFRELALKAVFQAALTCIRAVARKPDSSPSKIKMCNVGVNLAIQCLKYDFIGTNPDDSMIEMSNIHVPTTWRVIMQDKDVIPVLFQVYKGAKRLPSGDFPLYSEKMMELLALMAIVRRSIFFPAEQQRLEFLKRMLSGASDILRTQHGLSDPKVYHQFCRFLGKLKSNYQLTELVNTDGYQKWIAQASEFSIKSFNRWQLSSASSHYILQLWSRMVSAMPYVRDDTGTGGHMLKEYVPRVFQAYVNGTLQEIEAAVKIANGQTVVGIDGEVEHPLDDPDVLEIHLQFLPLICRYQYRVVAEFLVNASQKLWGQAKTIIQQIYEALGSNRSAIPALMVKRKIFEDQLAWMTYISSALVSGRLPTLNRRTDGIREELIDADLSKPIFVMLTVFLKWRHKLKPPYKPEPRLELALLHFFDTFQKTYVGEHRGMPPLGSSPALISSAAPSEKQQMYLRYFERLGMGRHTKVIETIITRLGINLKDWPSNDNIIGKTLQTFTNFVCGYSSGRMLLELQTVQMIIEHHSEKQFAFLKSKSAKVSDHRAKFFTALSRLIWLQDGTLYT